MSKKCKLHCCTFRNNNKQTRTKLASTHNMICHALAFNSASNLHSSFTSMNPFHNRHSFALHPFTKYELDASFEKHSSDRYFVNSIPDFHSVSTEPNPLVPLLVSGRDHIERPHILLRTQSEKFLGKYFARLCGEMATNFSGRRRHELFNILLLCCSRKFGCVLEMCVHFKCILFYLY